MSEQLKEFESQEWVLTSHPNVNWVKGSGANDNEWKNYRKVEVDPYQNRTGFDNYKLIGSAVTPRPVGFVSTISKDGHYNLAPFSYFNVVHTDPPVFTLGFSTGSNGLKDTPQNILDTKELTISIISEWFVEAANETSVAAPSDFDEWEVSGLTKATSTKVKPPHVAESAFSVEAKLLHLYELESKITGKPSGTVFLVEGINFHIREDVANKEFNFIDINKLKPISRLGGSTYASISNGYDLARPEYKQ